MNIIFNEIDVDESTYKEYILPVFLEVVEVYYDPRVNTAVILGRNNDKFVGVMDESQYNRLISALDNGSRTVDIRPLALFVNRNSYNYNKLFELSQEYQRRRF